MLKLEECVPILLAAGRSRRFGATGGKLAQEFLGRPLGLHVAATLGGMPFLRRLAIVGGSTLDYDRHGFELIHNPDRDLGMATSIRLGVHRAMALDARSILVVLADMPRVTATHVHRLFGASEDDRSVVVSSNGRDGTPPTLFGAALFADLLALDGDTGARALARGGQHVVTTPAELVDIDTIKDLDDLRRAVHGASFHAR